MQTRTRSLGHSQREPSPATPGRLYRHNWFSRSNIKSFKLWFLNGSREVGVYPMFCNQLAEYQPPLSSLVASLPLIRELKALSPALTDLTLMRGLIDVVRWGDYEMTSTYYLTPSHKFQFRNQTQTEHRWRAMIPGPTFDSSPLWQQQATLVKAANLIPGMFWLTITHGLHFKCDTENLIVSWYQLYQPDNKHLKASDISSLSAGLTHNKTDIRWWVSSEVNR